MKLEEEIQQRKFKNEKVKAFLNIYYTNCFLVSRFEEVLKEFDLTIQQFNILRIIRGQKEQTISIGEIKKRMLDKNSDVSRIIERLRLKKLITRVICKDDRRQTNVSITEKGLSLLLEIDTKENHFFKSFTAISEKEASLLNEMLDKMRE